MSATNEQVYLPPRQLSDFVIHYRNADFHVHQFVLHHHSAYFRTYLGALQPLVPVVRGRKRKSCHVDLSSSDERCGECSHSPLVRCIHLPDEFGIKSPAEVTPPRVSSSFFFAICTSRPLCTLPLFAPMLSCWQL